MTYSKPLPVLDPESRPFWEACKQHKLRFQRCRACSHPRLPATSFCPKCQSPEFDWVDASGRGKVFSWIVVRHPVPRDVYAQDVPYVVALVQLEEGPRLPTNIVGCAPEAVTAYMPVQVTFRDVTPEITLPVFEPAA
jgi:uncharacterized OB-fold protein